MPLVIRYIFGNRFLQESGVLVCSMTSLSFKIRDRLASGIPFCSIEVFPPSLEEQSAVLSKIQRLREICCPLFTAVACHNIPDLKSQVWNLSCFGEHKRSLLIHLPAAGLTKTQVLKFLYDAKDIGVKNILALRGDIKREVCTKGDFSHAVDLVIFIRKYFGSYFTLCVAGYPEGHPERASDEQDILYLKEKIDAGADFVITQMFFKCNTFIKFEQQCRSVGITVPIIPGIMPIKSYKSMKQIIEQCHIIVPREILEALELIKDNQEKVHNFGIHLAAQMVHELLPISNAVHFFTLNSDQTAEVCKQTGLYKACHGKKPYNSTRLSQE